MNSQQVGRAGEHYVAAEIHRRGGYAVLFSGNMAGIDMLATDLTGERRVSIQVKAKQTGTWQADGPRDGKPEPAAHDRGFFWIFVDLGASKPAYYVVPRAWMRVDIHGVDAPFRQRYERERGYPRKSHHHAIPLKRIAKWQDRWDALGIFDAAAGPI